MEKKYLQLNDIAAYKISFDLSNYVWDIVIKRDYLPRRTVGAQYTGSIDSISANVAEGFGRYFKKDKVRFFRYSYGSIMEALDWTQKAWKRKLLKKQDYEYILNTLKGLPKEINHLINYTNKKLKQ